ncbi:hypothetical protein SAMN04488136_10347 [Vibrio xiamenensis]|uniref:Uncharacterized protein n=2 Tax=Vibrio xiamenensis TaxID=861298 RepID=A0A1G7XAG9_9VIBR|nr:hypothetical protein SAMN04488136_10347 [Vibrio xiamenensis]
MKKVAITALISLFFGFLIHCAYIILNSNDLTNKELKDFNSFISVFELSNQKLFLTTQQLETSLIQKPVMLEQTSTALTPLLNEQKITAQDATMLNSLFALSQYSAQFFTHRLYGEMSLHSSLSNTLFSHFGFSLGKPNFEYRRCDTTVLCSEIPKALGQASHLYHSLIMRQHQPSLITVAAIEHQQQKVAQLMLEIPLQAFFTQPIVAVPSRSSNKVGVNIFLTSHQSLNYVKEVAINERFTLRAHISYLDIWRQNGYLALLYACAIFIALSAINLAKSQAKATRVEILEQDWFEDESQQIYNSQFLKSAMLTRIINNDVEDSAILVRYGHEQITAKYGQAIAQDAYNHLITQIKAFIRNSDYLIDLKNGELLIYLPKCSTDNADKVLKKIFYNLREERYSSEELQLKAFYFALSCKAGDKIQHILELARREIAKQAQQ